MAVMKVLTLAGLAKYDENMKAYIANKLLGKVTKEVVESLEAVSDPKEDVIYLVPNGGSGNNVKDEYMRINGKWELLGTTEVDLTNYATKTYAQEQAASAGATAESNAKAYADDKAKVLVSTVEYDATNKKITKTINGSKTDIVTAAKIVADGGGVTDISGKADKVSGATANNLAALDGNGNLKDSGKSAADFDAAGAAATAEQNAKDYADGLSSNYLHEADITAGNTNGTIKVKSKEVAVKGLGSAAYTESSAYATAAQGTKADTALQPDDFVEITYSGTGNEIDALFV